MKYKEDWDYAEEAHKKPCKKYEKHDEHSSCKDTCKKIRVINLWKSSSKY